MHAKEGFVPLERRRAARPAFAAAAVALALTTVLLALLFVAAVLVATMEGSMVEVARATNVASAVGEAFFGVTLPIEPAPEPSARVCWFSRACR